VVDLRKSLSAPPRFLAACADDHPLARVLWIYLDQSVDPERHASEIPRSPRKGIVKRKWKIEDGREEWPALFWKPKKGIWRLRNAKVFLPQHCRLSKPVAKLRSKDPGKADPIAREQVFVFDCSEGFTHTAGMDV